MRTINGNMLKDMILSGASMLEKNRAGIDSLNVFPVPDGDTGTNMSQTMAAAMREIASKDTLNASDIAISTAKGALKGARGNSGVILSQILRGFARAAENKEKIDGRTFAEMFKLGSDTAYKAMMKPREGTILTVIRVIGESVAVKAQETQDILELMECVIDSGQAILRKTPDMLPVLKQAGVVDSGGMGLVIMLMGFRAALKGETEPEYSADSGEDSATADFVDDHEMLDEILFAYCTEFLITHLSPELPDIEPERLRKKLAKIGDCVLVVSDGEVIKVHVHTNEPGRAIQLALPFGELDDIKINNMLEEFRERTRKQNERRALSEPQFLKDFGIVAVSLGAGLNDIFTDLAVDQIVDGGQTMNPSIDDLLTAVKRAGAKQVFILPNNSNIILAAQQTAELSDKKVGVIPTKSVAMGIAAAIAFSPDASFEDNIEIMTEAARAISTGQVTYAVRDSSIDGADIHESDILGIANSAITVIGKQVDDVSIELINGMIKPETELITMFYGSDVAKEDAEALRERMIEICPGCDVELHYGGQPLYYYIFSLE